MTTYLLRRLLLMIPTLIGITFVVFMLVALSPGGVGASLRVAGGQMEASSRAIQEAYLEDRYGLGDPAPVQYLRWLGRVSPIKFGERALVSPDGELIREPRALDRPVAWWWFTDSLPTAPVQPFAFEAGAAPEEMSRAYRRAAQSFAEARSRYVRERVEFEQAVGTWLRSNDYAAFVKADGTLREGRLTRSAIPVASLPAAGDPGFDAVRAAGAEMLDAYRAALEARTGKIEVMRAGPYPREGFAIGPVGFAWPDLGQSMTRQRPVLTLIAEHLPATLMLNIVATIIIYAISVPSGIAAAVGRGGVLDTGLGSLYIALWSFPVPLAGVLAIGYLASDQYLGWFPVAGLHSSGSDAMPLLPGLDAAGEFTHGFLLDTMWHLCLPVMCLVYTGFAVLSKQTRAAMLDNFNADYVRTAKAKGVAGPDIVMRHVFRNSLLPIITMFVSVFPAMLSGSVVIESIFSINGMGRLALDAINQRDRELLLATTVIIAAVNLLALLLADILYALADPRITYE